VASTAKTPKRSSRISSESTVSAPTPEKTGLPVIATKVTAARPVATISQRAAAPVADVKQPVTTLSVGEPVGAPLTVGKSVATVALTAPARHVAPVTVPRVVTGLLAAFGLGPLAGNAPLAPAEPPVLWGLMAFARREFEKTLSNAARIMNSGSTGVAAETVAPAAALTATTMAAAAVAAGPRTVPVGWVTGQGPVGPNLLPRTNDTSYNLGIGGTDLGIMWDNGIKDNPATPINEHQVLMAFGDTFSGTGQTGYWRSNVLLRSIDQNPADGLSVVPVSNGTVFGGSSTGNPANQFIVTKGAYLGPSGSEVTLIPTSGISVPYAVSSYGTRQYVTFMSVKSWDSPGRWTTNYAGIAYSDDNGQT
jgi:hypothetical protein